MDDNPTTKLFGVNVPLCSRECSRLGYKQIEGEQFCLPHALAKTADELTAVVEKRQRQ